MALRSMGTEYAKHSLSQVIDLASWEERDLVSAEKLHLIVFC